MNNIYIDLEKLVQARGFRQQQDVAALIGISPQRLSNYENGVSRIPGYLLARLCMLYGVRIEHLTREGQKNLKKSYKAA